MNVQRVFGCGIDGQVFKTKNERLSIKNQSRLGRVAGRVWLTLKLRYEMAFCNNPFPWRYEEYSLRHVELPSIEVYLLCTCLDTLAGKPVHKNFKDWIEEQPNTNNFGKEDIKSLYSQYEAEYGVGKKLRDLFKNLPQSVKVWLASNVAIRRSDQPLAPERQNVDKLLDRLYRYFYNYRRNNFTHGSVSRPTLVAEDVREPLDGGWWVTPASGTHFVLYSDRPNQKWNLSYRQGLDEATILRIIIYAVALQILGIELTNELIDTNLRNYSRLDALHAFVTEVNRNSALASLWAKIDDTEMTDLRSHLIGSGISLLSSEASNIMIERYLDNPLESGLRQMTSQYLEYVNQLNSLVSDFNEANPSVSNGCDRNERWRTIKEFLENLGRMPSYNSVVKWPSKKEMTNLWLVIRDPCYTPGMV